VAPKGGKGTKVVSEKNDPKGFPTGTESLKKNEKDSEGQIKGRLTEGNGAIIRGKKTR